VTKLHQKLAFWHKIIPLKKAIFRNADWKIGKTILLMVQKSGDHHLGGIKPLVTCKSWDKHPHKLPFPQLVNAGFLVAIQPV